MSVEQSSLVQRAETQYNTYDMGALPPELQRDSRYFYYLSVYPGLKEMHKLPPDEQPELPEVITSAYVHTPYCTGVCSFCSYFLTTVSESDTSPISAYLGTVQQEVLQRSRQTDLDLSYLYFGGGTPSLIPNKALETFFDFLNKNHNTQFFNEFSLTKYRQRIEAGESPIWRGHRFEGQDGIHRDVMFSLKNSPYLDRELFVQKYNIDPAEFFTETFERLQSYNLITVDDATMRITLTPKGRLCVEEIACLFQIPGLKNNIPANASPSERRKLDKHNFFPLYSLVNQPRE